jgi:hypothetical protein
LGFKAVIGCVDERCLDRSFAGREFDQSFLDDLPEKADPCGEYGEFHSFAYDGPLFHKPVAFARGEIVYRTYVPPPRDDGDDGGKCGTANSSRPTTGFWYCDLVPA